MPGSVVHFDPSGKVKHFTDRVAKDAVVQNIHFEERTPVTYYPNGRLRSLQVVKPIKFKGKTYPIGHWVFFDTEGALTRTMYRVGPNETVSGIRFDKQALGAFDSKGELVALSPHTGLKLKGKTLTRGTMGGQEQRALPTEYGNAGRCQPVGGSGRVEEFAGVDPGSSGGQHYERFQMPVHSGRVGSTDSLTWAARVSPKKKRTSSSASAGLAKR